MGNLSTKPYFGSSFPQSYSVLEKMLGTFSFINEMNSVKYSVGNTPSFEISASQSIISSPVFSSISWKEKGSTESNSFFPSSSLNGNLNRSFKLSSSLSSTSGTLNKTFLQRLMHSSWQRDIVPIVESSIISKSFSERLMIRISASWLLSLMVCDGTLITVSLKLFSSSISSIPSETEE